MKFIIAFSIVSGAISSMCFLITLMQNQLIDAGVFFAISLLNLAIFNVASAE